MYFIVTPFALKSSERIIFDRRPALRARALLTSRRLAETKGAHDRRGFRGKVAAAAFGTELTFRDVCF
jgi:hypothetical protein